MSFLPYIAVLSLILSGVNPKIKPSFSLPFFNASSLNPFYNSSHNRYTSPYLILIGDDKHKFLQFKPAESEENLKGNSTLGNELSSLLRPEVEEREKARESTTVENDYKAGESDIYPVDPNRDYINASTSTTEKTPGEGDGPWIQDLTWDDATWILTASFIIFTMQTGFGMLESGCVSVRNESNIMMKNVVDVVFGGLTYWLFGFSISFGTDKGSSPYFGVGEYAVDSENNLMGPVFAAFMFQLSFATTATTIVSGTMAERCNFKAYCIFSLLNTVVYCVPARWIWGPSGFLGEMGVVDIAGSGAVHLLGGISGFIAAWMLGPRLGRYEHGTKSLPLGNPTSCVVGLYILWWGWLAFNSGSTFGVSGEKWKFAARAAVTTLIASIGGGLVGSGWTLLKPGRIFEVMDIVNPILGALVGVTAGCALYHTIDAFIVGAIGAAVVIITNPIADSLRVDDPVGATAVHAFGGLWGLVAVAIFAEEDAGLGFTKGHAGLLRGGDWYLMKVQLIAAACIAVWAVSITWLLLWGINIFVPIRMEAHEELLGADFVEHCVRRRHIGFTPILSAMRSHSDIQFTEKHAVIVGSSNPAHEQINSRIKYLGPSEFWKKVRAKAIVASTFVQLLRSHQRVADVQHSPQMQTYTVTSPEATDIVRRYLGTPAPFTISSTIDETRSRSGISRNGFVRVMSAAGRNGKM